MAAHRIFLPLVAAIALSSAMGQNPLQQAKPLRYCNPIPLPSYPVQHRSGRDMRSMADPTVFKFKDKWYLYPSNGLAWWSENLVNWHYQPVTLPGAPPANDPVIWAPSVMEHNGAFYLTANELGLYRASDPLGPWELLGRFTDEDGKVFRPFDAMLFRDDDGKVYLYWSGGSTRGIFGVELDANDLTKFSGRRQHFFQYELSHAWERGGDFNELTQESWIEAPFMTKYKGRYYLQYSAPGTEWKTYAVGLYVGDKPLGPFRYDARSPLLAGKNGLLTGSAHHAVFEGPRGTLWTAYHILYKNHDRFERRLAMDAVGFDDKGQMVFNGPTETPQWAPGVKTEPWKGNDSGSLPLTVGKPVVSASSSAYGHNAAYAIDNYVRTWWEAAEGDRTPSISIDLMQNFLVDSARILWSDAGLDIGKGITPAPYRYKIELSRDGKTFTTAVDKAGNSVDNNIEFDEIPPERARYVRLTVTGAPARMPIGVVEFTVFGKP